MMRRFALLAAGAVLGGLVTGSVAQFGGNATAAATDTYRQLNLFGDVFERIRADYVEEPDEGKLIESASRMLPRRPAFDLPECQRLSGPAGQTPRGLRPRHRGHHGILALNVISPIDDTPAYRPAFSPAISSRSSTVRKVRSSLSAKPWEDARARNSSIVLTVIRRAGSRSNPVFAT